MAAALPREMVRFCLAVAGGRFPVHLSLYLQQPSYATRSVEHNRTRDVWFVCNAIGLYCQIISIHDKLELFTKKFRTNVKMNEQNGAVLKPYFS